MVNQALASAIRALLKVCEYYTIPYYTIPRSPGVPCFSWAARNTIQQRTADAAEAVVLHSAMHDDYGDTGIAMR